MKKLLLLLTFVIGGLSSIQAQDSIKIYAGVQDGDYFEFLFSDDVDSCNKPDGFDEIYLTLESDGTTSVRAGAIDGFALRTGLSLPAVVYTLTISEGLKVSEESVVTFIDGAGASTFSF